MALQRPHIFEALGAPQRPQLSGNIGCSVPMAIRPRAIAACSAVAFAFAGAALAPRPVIRAKKSSASPSLSSSLSSSLFSNAAAGGCCRTRFFSWWKG